MLRKDCISQVPLKPAYWTLMAVPAAWLIVMMGP
jgi:hypothetical protein